MLLKFEEPKPAEIGGTVPHCGIAASHSRRVDPLYLFARSVQWRQACHHEAFRELSRAQASPDPTTSCIAKSLLKRCGSENTNGHNQE